MKRLAMLILIGSFTFIGCNKKEDAPVATPPTSPTQPTQPPALNPISISGLWSGNLALTFTGVTPQPGVVNVSFTLIQSGSSFSGTYNDSAGVSGTVTGTVQTDTSTGQSGILAIQRYGNPILLAFTYVVYTNHPWWMYLVPTSTGVTGNGGLSQVTSSASERFPGLGL